MSNSRSNRGIGTIIWYLACISLIVAFLKVPSHQTASGWVGYFEGKTNTIHSWIDSWVHDDYVPPDLRLQK